MTPASPDQDERFREAIRAGGQKVTPYRMGQQASTHYRDALAKWRAVPGANLGMPRPMAPLCPYSERVSVKGWRTGYDYTMGKR